MGWWLQFIGLALLVIGGIFSWVGFVISPQQTIISSIRSLFSQTQSIKVLPSSLGGNSTLNLDNIATLILHVPYSMDSVTLLLDVVPVVFPDRYSNLITIEDAQYYNQSNGKQYVFDTGKNKRHEIDIGGRIFIVTLLKIIKLNVAKVSNAIEYQFGISEKQY